MRGRLGLRGRVILLLLVAFAVLGGAVAWNFVDNREQEIRDSVAMQFAQARLIAANQRALSEESKAMLNGLMVHPALRHGAPATDCSRVLVEAMRQGDEFANIALLRPDGEVACSAVPFQGRVSAADRPWFRDALASRDVIVSDLIVGRILNRKVIIFAKAMRDEAGRVTGVLYLSVDLNWLNRQLAKIELPEGGRFELADGQGNIAARHPDPEQWTDRNAAHVPLVKRILAESGEGTLEETGLDGVNRLFAYAPLFESTSGSLYRFWISVPKAVIEARAWRTALRDMSIMLAVLVAALGLIVAGSHRLLVRPLMSLSQAAARFKAGDFATRSGLPHGDDEIGQLAQMLDETAEAIEARERGLERVNRALRVQSAANRTLLRAGDEQQLHEDMCRAIVEAGGFRIASVSFAEQDPERSVRPVALWGAGAELLEGLNVSWSDTAMGRGPTGRAIREGRIVTANHIMTDPAYATWHERAQSFGYAAVLALPLRIDGAVAGALTIFAAEPDAFDEDAIKLLSEAADDLAYGIATRRNEAEQGRTRTALTTAEERFRAMADASLDALFILKSVRGEHGEILDFAFTDLNPRAEQMLGMTREKVVGQKLCELLPINRTGGFFDKYLAVATSGTPLEEEFAIDTPEIAAKWLRHQVVKVGDGIAISSRDISEWREAATAMKRLQEQNTLILNSAGEGLFGLDMEGRATFANPAAAAMLQWPPEELAGQYMHALHHHSRADGKPYPAEQCPIHAAYREGVVHHIADEVFWRKDGTCFPVEYVSTPIRDGQGKLLGAVVSFNDISERKANERALARASRALRTLSAGNEALVRATNEEDLLQSVTHNIVEQGGYRLARVSYAEDNPEKTLRRVASAGVGEDFFPQEQLTWADVEKPQAPIARVIRSGMPQLCRDIAGDPAFAPWKEAALAQGYASHIGLPLRNGERCFGGLSIYSAERDAFDDEEARLLTELADDLAYGIITLRTRIERDRIVYAHEHHAEILQKSLEQSIQAIADTVEARDPYTAGHQRRVSELAVAIAREMGLPEETIHGIQLAATIHDLGKIHIPAEILSKPGKLSDIEFMFIKTHPQAGYDILKDIAFPWPIADMVWQHHEKLDGSGYPQGLKDGQIRLEARIMTVADVVEAMSSHRPYRASLGIEVALREIERGRGSAFDAAVVDACLKLFHEGRFAFQG